MKECNVGRHECRRLTDIGDHLADVSKTIPMAKATIVTERQSWKGHQVKKLDVLTGMVTMERNKEVHFPRGTNV